MATLARRWHVLWPADPGDTSRRRKAGEPYNLSDAGVVICLVLTCVLAAVTTWLLALGS